MISETQRPVPALFRTLGRVNRHASEDFLGGPRVLKMAWVINLQKATTVLFVAMLMVSFRNFSTAAWVYLALHGTYGLCWLLKHVAFPDASWERRITWGGAFLTNMVHKEASMSRYPEWSAYRQRTWMLLPRPGRRSA